jgi:hypothetical protein
MTRILPGIIGIGRARTGTSAFFLKGIGKHPPIVLGSKKRVLGHGNKELNFFTNEKFLRKGLDFYAKFFDQQKCGVKYRPRLIIKNLNRMSKYMTFLCTYK